MSNRYFPTLPGLNWSNKKTPIWSTNIQTSSSGKELRASYFSYPKWQFSLSYEFLRDNGEDELQALIGLFNQCRGSFDTFLYTDPDDNSVVDQAFGVGDGVTTKFGLVRSYASCIEPVMATNGTPIIKKDGTPTTAFTQTNNLITFASPPANGQLLTWSGAFYYKCRFLQDSMDFEQFLYHLWTAKKVEFVSVK
ncbi:DUF2460 domain-containing protein [Polynucleobacter sp. AP-RePozz3-80-G7]|uniref:DUF2460 domain-containing protein n=1 Tax=Polynucleobacter sp. AP-RePozz3-80-G7 TaxID=2689105 RepID=UPI001C0E897B|nr:DUF2460 domain-containing protein [Polynucleobacter sp. AP-RePozz3-80-G7]MBU3640019.1 DUF2460 domain-containing protein [Polynucleobacter sp. AP-RePozz3-80-G7]